MIQQRKVWRRRPKFLIPNNDEERRVSRLDLFFDLIFVVIFRQLFKLITDDIGFEVVREYTLYFIPLRTIWQAMVFYTQRFEDTTIRHRWYMFVVIGLLTFAASTLHSELIYHFEFFVGAYISIKGLIAYMIYSAISANCDNTKPQKVSKSLLRILSGLHIGTALLRSILFFYPQLWAFVVFTSLVAEIIVFFVAISKKKNSLPPFHLGHFLERYGLLMMVALAELIYAIVDGASGAISYSLELGVTEIALLGVTFGIRRMYYDQITYRELRPDKSAIMNRSYLHLPLTYGIVLFGGIALYIMSTSYIESTVFTLRWMFTVCIACIYVLMGVLSSFHNTKSLLDDIIFPDRINKRFLISKLIGAILAFIILYLTRNQSIQLFLILQLVVIGLLNLEGVWYWIQAKETNSSIGSYSKEESGHEEISVHS